MYTVIFPNGESMSTSDKETADAWKAKGYEVSYHEMNYVYWEDIKK